MNNPETLIFVCCNQKATGKCCANNGAEEALEYLRAAIKARKDTTFQGRKVKAVKTSCLGRCAQGPSILIVPDQIWYTFETLADLNEIIESHLIEGKIVRRCLM